MNTSQRSSTIQRSTRPVRIIPSTRVSKARSLTALSDALNSLQRDFDVARTAVDGLVPFVDARAGMIQLQPPISLTYAKHVEHSERLSSFENMLKQRSETILAMFAIESHKRIHEAEGLTLLPLIWQGKVIGLLAFDREEKRIGPLDEAGLLSVCNQLAAILGARQPAARSGETHSATEAIEQAVAMQQSLLPSVPSQSCGLSIATHTQAVDYVSGDYFDLILVDHDKMGIVIADVEGKGVSAALFGNMLRTTVHFLTRESPSTSSVVGKINTILHKEASTTQKLFTLFYAVFDPLHKWLNYTGSGHVSPVVIRSEQGVAERLISEGIPIGIEPRQRFSERSLQLGTGDLVAFFTDGLCDCVNDAGMAFGEQRLTELLCRNRHEPVERVLKTLLNELSVFAPAPTDDMTIILAKVM